mgnify:CR=1 FL=1
MYSGLHFLVDFLCAAAMFGIFIPGKSGYLWILIYNFCAFALQMPFGVLLDMLDGCGKKHSAAEYTVLLGVLLTVAGTFSHPVILGIGNALFHVGGGVATIREDYAGHFQGTGLGIFVAPGAFGLYIGTLLSKAGWCVQSRAVGILLVCILTGLLLAVGQESRWESCGYEENETAVPSKYGFLCLICLGVVILRSYVGMAVAFPWKNTLAAGVLCVSAVVLGKIAGGFFAAGIGMKRAVCSSLAAAAFCYVLSDVEVFGVLSLFFFNMSMPMTLYLLVREYRKLAGFAFGLLTFGLFLGFLPVYFATGNPLDGRLTGCLGSIVSLVFLYWGVKRSYVDVSM